MASIEIPESPFTIDVNYRFDYESGTLQSAEGSVAVKGFRVFTADLTKYFDPSFYPDGDEMEEKTAELFAAKLSKLLEGV